jgi:hypothetical protein
MGFKVMQQKGKVSAVWAFEKVQALVFLVIHQALFQKPIQLHLPILAGKSFTRVCQAPVSRFKNEASGAAH